MKTVLASGNVLFDSPSTDIPTLKKQIESALAREFGYEAWVFVLDLPTLQAIVDNYPFEREREVGMLMRWLPPSRKSWRN